MRRSWRRTSRWRRRRTAKRTTRTLALVVIAVTAFAALPPSTWRDVERLAQGHLDVLEKAIAPAAGRAADWLAGGEGALRDAVGQGSTGATLSGSARVIDGDTLEIRGRRIRLHGIDAPESAQRCRSGGRSWPCGREATRALSVHIAGRPVVCKERDRDRYGRSVAVCRAGGEDLNTWMVAAGWALAYRKYSRSHVAEERAAKAAGRGIWRGDVVAPWEWRKGKRLAGADTRTDAQQCNGRPAIKGNISKDGSRIYHVPGGRYYERTRINRSKGERWFCSEAEARAAGWRRSRPRSGNRRSNRGGASP